MTSKVTNDGTNDTEAVDYTYNLQNRLETVTTTPYTGGVADTTVSVIGYTYNTQGIRTSKQTWTETSGVGNGDDVTTTYLIDPYNRTGYAQVLEETVGSSPTLFYTIGDDVLARCKNVGPSRRFMVYDGHGSVRQLARANGTEIESYSYDGYGVLLQDDSESLPGTTPEQGTSLLYAGEYFDYDSQMYYNRARWYNPLNGRFNRTDPYAGNMQDPQSLHKYAYAHANPINATDPSGEFSTISVIVAFVVYVAIAAPAMYLYNRYNPYKERIRKKFDSWYKRQTIGWWIDVLPKCPLQIDVSGGNPSYDGPEKEKWEKPKVPESAEERLHPEIKYSMRSKVFQGHTNQATYNASGNLYSRP